MKLTRNDFTRITEGLIILILKSDELYGFKNGIVMEEIDDLLDKLIDLTNFEK